VKNGDFDDRQIVGRDGNGEKDRVTVLPVSAMERFRKHLLGVKRLHDADHARGEGRVMLPYVIAVKYPNANAEWAWQGVFPAREFTTDPARGRYAVIIRMQRVCSAKSKRRWGELDFPNRLFPVPRGRQSIARVRKPLERGTTKFQNPNGVNVVWNRDQSQARVVGDFPELNSRRVAVAVHGEGDFQGFTPLAIHFRRVAAKTNAIVGCGGGLSFGRREPIGVGCELDLLPFLHGEWQVQHGSGIRWRLLGFPQSQGDVSQ
jgi:hypothetical protein